MSIFRLIVGSSLLAQRGQNHPIWGKGNTAAGEVKLGEQALEREVSEFIGKMPFLWLGIADEAGPDSARGYIERNAIAPRLSP